MIRYTLALFSAVILGMSTPVYADEPPESAPPAKGFISLKNVHCQVKGVVVAAPTPPPAVDNFIPIKPRASKIPAPSPTDESSEMTPEKAHLLLSMFTISD